MIYDTLNPQVVRFVLEDIKAGMNVLDVGCGTGRLGGVLKTKVDCFITGIEISKEAACIAKEAYDEVMIMDLERLINHYPEFKSEKKYNYIIFADILEHVTKPEVLLELFRDFLQDDGFLVASIPNIANWMIRIRLLLGNFDYFGGILDETHLRFFTYKTARKILENHGYKIVDVVNNNSSKLFSLLGRYWMSMFAFQFVFKCIKKGREE